MQRQNWETALSAQAEIVGLLAGPLGKSYRHYWLEDRAMRYGLEAADASAASFNTLLPDLLAADPLYVAPEMHHLVIEAMRTFDAREPLHQQDVLFPVGFAYLSEPYIAPDRWDKATAFRAISWKMDDFLVRYEKDGPTEVTTCLKITLWSHTGDEDGYPDWSESIPGEWEWGVLHTTTLPLKLAHELQHTRGEGDPKASWITYLRVLHRLMAERIVQPSRRQASRPVRREALRRGMPEVKDVLVVELRRVSTKGEGDPEGRHYSHSFMVNGHWRNQWYPSLGVHRQKWIHPYVKGDGDFREKQRIWVFDR